MSEPRAIVIGAGVAGLAVSIRLATQGYQVTVYEKNSTPGGKLSLVEQDGYRFDAGPSLFTEPGLIEDLFDLAGEPIQPYFSWQPVPVSCRYFFTNGKIANAYTDRVSLLNEFGEKLGESAEILDKYLNNTAKTYDAIGSIFMGQPVQKSKTWLRKTVLGGLAVLNPSLVYHTLNEYNENKLTTGEAIQIFNRFATYNGSNPYSAPAMLSLISNVELNRGVFYPDGGMISITNALYKLAMKMGVVFEFDKPVSRIIHTGTACKGVVVDNENIFSDIVVTDADIHFVYSQLLRQPRKAAALAKREASSSAVVFYWGVGKRFDNLDLHNILFSGAYKTEFEHIFLHKNLYKDPTVYINITAKMESAHAPADKENWFVMINAPSGTTVDWEAQIPLIRQQVLKKIRGTLKEDIEPLIETEKVLHPGLISSNTNAFRGALYGQSSNTRKAAFFRPANYDKDFPGLFFCGGTVHPGGGIPLCLKSAEIVSELVRTSQSVH